MKIGFAELIIVFIVALVVIGPDKLPQFAKKLGEALGQLRKVSSDAADDIKKSVAEPLEEIRKPLDEAMEPLKDTDRAVKDNIREMKKSINEIGKKKEAGSQKTEETVPQDAKDDETKEAGTQ